MATGGWRAWQPPADDERRPTGLAVAGGAVVVVGAAVLAALLVDTPGPRLGLLTATVLVFTAAAGDGKAAIGVSAMAWAVGNGFLINRLGQLTWHGRLDVWFVMGLLSAVSVGMVTAQVREGMRSRRRWHPFVALLNEQLGPGEPASQTWVGRPDDPGPDAEPVEDKER